MRATWVRASWLDTWVSSTTSTSAMAVAASKTWPRRAYGVWRWANAAEGPPITTAKVAAPTKSPHQDPELTSTAGPDRDLGRRF